MIVDFAIHDPNPPGHHPHAHVMLTMRAMDGHGKWLPKSRKVYDLDENGERIKLPSGRWKSHKEDTVDWNDRKYCEIWRHEYPMLCGAILHSDRGTQYTSELYRKAINKYGIRQSMNSAGGRCHDNEQTEEETDFFHALEKVTLPHNNNYFTSGFLTLGLALRGSKLIVYGIDEKKGTAQIVPFEYDCESDAYIQNGSLAYPRQGNFLREATKEAIYRKVQSDQK